MDKFDNLEISRNALTDFDFAHCGVDYHNTIDVIFKDKKGSIYKTDGSAITDSNKGRIRKNLRVVEDRLGLNKIIYDLTQAQKSSASALLTKKLARLISFRNLACDFCLQIIQNMYWIDFLEDQKSNLSLTDCSNFAIQIMKELSDKFVKRLDDEYNIAKAIQEEFSKSGKF